jgi:predicted permease
MDDLRFAIRGLMRAPALTLTLVVSLALGAGANAMLYSMARGLLVRVPAVADPGSLVSLYTSQYGGGRFGESSFPDLESIAATPGPFDDIAASDESRLQTVQAAQRSREVRVAAVSASFFTLLGLTPYAGRLPDHAAANEALIGFALWNELGGDHAVLGRALVVGDREYVIAGVAPPDFIGLSLQRECGLWIPLAADAALADRGRRRLSLVARLKAGSGVEAANAHLSRIAEELADRFPDTNRGAREAADAPRLLTAVPYSRLDPALASQAADIGAVVLGAAALLLAGAGINAGGLLLSRAVGRRRQFGVQALLGATRARLIRVVLAESLLVALGSAALGLMLAGWTAAALPAQFAPEHARFLDTRLDAAAAAVTLAVAALAAVLFGIGPAVHAAKANALSAVGPDAGGVSETRGGTRIRSALVLAQVALSAMIVGGSGVLWTAMAASLGTGFGVAPSQVAIAAVQLTQVEHHEWQGRERQDDVQRTAASIAGVEAVAWTTALPMKRENRRRYTVRSARGAEETIEPEISLVSRNYFDVMGISLIEGRGFTSVDELHQAPVVVVSDTLAREYFGDSAVGGHLEDRYGQRLEIVGVVRSGKHRTLQEPPPPMVYHPMTREYVALQYVIARAAPGREPPVDALRTAIDRLVTLRSIDTLGARLAGTLSFDRLTMTLVGVSAAAALLLAMMGVYGVMNDAVRQRRREIGLRMALGARPAAIGRFVVARALGFAAAGLAAGLAGQAALVRLLDARVAIGGLDAPALAATLGALTLAVALASIVPIRRALRVHPAVTLRAL